MQPIARQTVTRESWHWKIFKVWCSTLIGDRQDDKMYRDGFKVWNKEQALRNSE